MATIPLFFSLILFLRLYHASRLEKRKEVEGEGIVAAEDLVSENDNPQGDDEVLPVHFIDQAAIVRTSIINYTFRYNEVLDAAKLHRGLLQLLKIPGWNKLGGRLRATVSDPVHLSTADLQRGQIALNQGHSLRVDAFFAEKRKT